MSQVETNQNMTHCIEEDEIDLRELWKTIKGGKKIIFTTMFVIVTATLVYVLSIPNVYKSEAVLIPKEEKGSSLGGLGGLAAMAGISVGGGSMTPDIAFDSLLKNYEFMKNFIVKNKIYEYYTDENVDRNYVFALGYRGVYELFKSKKDEEDKDYEKELFDLVKKVQKSLSISADKKSGLITVAYSDSDREFTPKVVNAFLNDASEYLVKNNLDIIESKLNYFQKELQKAESFELRTSISGMISNIVQEKVMMKSKRYYQCDVLTSPSVSYIKDKTKPKRALILVVSFITSLILGIFIVFFRNFIKNEENGATTLVVQ